MKEIEELFMDPLWLDFAKAIGDEYEAQMRLDAAILDAWRRWLEEQARDE